MCRGTRSHDEPQPTNFEPGFLVASRGIHGRSPLHCWECWEDGGPGMYCRLERVRPMAGRRTCRGRETPPSVPICSLVAAPRRVDRVAEVALRRLCGSRPLLACCIADSGLV